MSIIRPRYGIAEVAFVVLVIWGLAWGWSRAEISKVAALLQESALPAITVTRGPINNSPAALRSDYEFTSDWFTPSIPVWTAVLEPYRGKPGINYLEIGAYEGRSAIWMLENILTDASSRLTAVDVFYGDYEARYRRNIERTGAADRVTTLKGASQVEARKLALESFDLIYIDGSHAAPDVLEDAVLCWRLLKPRGLMIFDDYRWVGALGAGHSGDSPSDFPKPAIDAFTRCFAGKFDTVHNAYQLILRKRPKAS
jgi:hypothetical protein